VNDPKKNTAYTLHYYANSHNWSGNYDWGGESEGSKGEKAMNAGLSVFVSEWGTANSDGNGNPDQSRNQSWQDYMNKHKLSWANWSASYISEGTAAFQNGSSKTSLQYTTSSNLVKGYLSTNPTTYKACHDVTPESSSSSVIAIPFFKSNDQFSVSFANGKLALESSASGATKIEVFDLLGNTRLQKEESLSSGSHLVDIGALPAGSYLARVRQGANIRQVRFDIR
jgi:endoglucanase